MATANDHSSPDAYTSPNSVSPAPSSGGSRGCLYGCLFAILGGIALLICGGLGTYWFVTEQVEKYTSTTPAEFPSVEYSEEELADVQNRIDSYSEAFDQDQTPEEDLVLTANEINIMIAEDDDLRGKVFVRIKDGQLSGDVSIPTDSIPGGSGRYFNGSASLEVSMVAGDIFVTLVDAEVNGDPLPQPFIDGIAQENLAKEFYQDPDIREKLRLFESISVEGDKLILKVKRDQESEPEENSEPSPGDADVIADDQDSEPQAADE